MKVPETRLRRRKITRKSAVKNCGEKCTEWKYDTIAGDNLCHKFI
jgi:hypothetical protein